MKSLTVSKSKSKVSWVFCKKNIMEMEEKGREGGGRGAEWKEKER